MTKFFPDLKAGDAVFVVYQRGPHGFSVARSGTEIVTRVGRLYGYARVYGVEAPFLLSTGMSHHPGDHNARANGFGFDVYPSKADFHAAEAARRQAADLWEKLRRVRPVDLRRVPAAALDALSRALDAALADL